MTRLEQIYCTAYDTVCEEFENEISELADHRTNRKFNHIVESVIDRMKDDKLTMVDIITFEHKIYYYTYKAVSDAVYMEQFLNKHGYEIC